jgi:hypothetical protein
MTRFLMLGIAAGVAFSATSAFAANERVRGIIADVSGDTLTPDIKVRSPYMPAAPRLRPKASVMSIRAPKSARRPNPWVSSSWL